MGFKLKTKQPAKGEGRATGPAMNHDPRLNGGEVALDLDSGESVSVVVQTERMLHGAGMVFIAVSRLIEADGSTAVDDQGEPVFSEFRHTADAKQIDELGIDAISREVALAVLGEAPTKKGDEELIPWSPALKLNVSVRNVAKLAKASGKAMDARAVLGI